MKYEGPHDDCEIDVPHDHPGKPKRKPRDVAGTPLTPQERQILARLANDMNRDEVAEELGISPLTVRSHLQTAYRRLRVKTLVGALIKMGWLHPPEIEED